jgi:RNA polymerase sigma-70 factor (ECF subfamily)
MTKLLFFPTLCLAGSNSPPVASVGLSTQIGAEIREGLSGETMEKVDIMPRPTTMSEGLSTGDPLPDDVSALLRAWTNGDQGALARLTPIVYNELHRLAHYYLKREQAGHSLQTTALVNEAYMRLVDYKRMQWQNRAHFMATAAQAMRRILVDHARRHNLKRGAGAEHVSFDADAVMCPDRSDDFVSLDEALSGLAKRAPRKAKVVELRFFGGLSVEETAEVLRVSPITVMREWKSAKAWLYRELAGPTANGQ